MDNVPQPQRSNFWPALWSNVIGGVIVVGISAAFVTLFDKPDQRSQVRGEIVQNEVRMVPVEYLRYADQINSVPRILSDIPEAIEKDRAKRDPYENVREKSFIVTQLRIGNTGTEPASNIRVQADNSVDFAEIISPDGKRRFVRDDSVVQVAKLAPGDTFEIYYWRDGAYRIDPEIKAYFDGGRIPVRTTYANVDIYVPAEVELLAWAMNSGYAWALVLLAGLGVVTLLMFGVALVEALFKALRLRVPRPAGVPAASDGSTTLE